MIYHTDYLNLMKIRHCSWFVFLVKILHNPIVCMRDNSSAIDMN